MIKNQINRTETKNKFGFSILTRIMTSQNVNESRFNYLNKNQNKRTQTKNNKRALKLQHKVGLIIYVNEEGTPVREYRVTGTTRSGIVRLVLTNSLVCLVLSLSLVVTLCLSIYCAGMTVSEMRYCSSP